jgi:allantoate deiminase
MHASAQLLGRYLAELAQVTDEPGQLTRTFLSPAMRRANALVATWMRAAGLATREDTVGNLIGRLEAPTAPRARTLLLGSHLDTVRDAGRFDGALGVLLPIVALAELRRRGVTLPFAVEVLGFSEEEGVRFASAYLGSKGYCGQLRAADLKLTDAAGLNVRTALETLTPTAQPFVLPRRAHAPRDLLGYVEVHIEQGPVLEAKKLAVGVVSAIAGQTRAKLAFHGRAGHAGTTPMPLRRDALAGAAEFTLAAEALARRTPGLVATVGTMSVAPGAANVIPAAATFSVDLRHPRDVVRRSALRQLRATAARIARRRQLTFTWNTTQDNAAVTCSPALTAALTASVRAVQGKTLALSSGAGHDAVVLSALTPVAMVFVRSRAGLSHHPDEFSSPADIALALEVLIDFLARLARTHTS